MQFLPDFNSLNINYANLNNLSNGQVAEILMWTRALTDTEMNTVTNYLATKWGLSLN